jgi:hypothetical protein
MFAHAQWDGCTCLDKVNMDVYNKLKTRTRTQNQRYSFFSLVLSSLTDTNPKSFEVGELFVMDTLDTREPGTNKEFTKVILKIFSLTHLFFAIKKSWCTIVIVTFDMRYFTSYADPGHKMWKYLPTAPGLWCTISGHPTKY